MLRQFVYLSLALSSVGLALTTPAKRQGSLPILTLDYGRFQASNYDALKDIYTFSNIRFAEPPVGQLRWAKPVRPTIFNSTISDGSYGNQCVQGSPGGVNVLGSLNELGGPAGTLNGLIDGVLPVGTGGDEDCLFLDVYVPGSAIRNPSGSSLPVVVWIYGGAYVFGSKNQGMGVLPLYDGTGLLQESNNQMIFVTGNYRVGSFGFLAGTTMEKEGLPNAGYYDQRAVFQWVQDYIYLLGGDKTQVSAWGESAGAGSILHHLTAFGGTQDPLFRKAVMQSVASELFVDRKGDLDNYFKFFATEAGCDGQGVACLRNASSANLIAANKALIAAPPPCAFGPGPAADGAWIRQMPALELATGNFWKDIDGLILSHVSDEPTLFITGEVDTNQKFNDLANFIIPDYALKVLKDVIKYFPAPGPNSNYSTETDRVSDYLRTTNFVCNYRYLTNAYAGKTWNIQYSVPPGYHATDLLATFYNDSFNFTLFNIINGSIPLVPLIGPLFQAYQSYLTSFAITGDPNTLRRATNLPPAIAWPHPTGLNDQYLTNVLDTNLTGFTLFQDTQAPLSNCEFFFNVQAAITTKGGYSPPGAVVGNNLGITTRNPSRNYKTPA